eukprot:TRINITY_DN49723_c0_g1_i1.p1 TRINITY_DN49723_c0_g1~~TRINITY_DN49723_c0_g1_i1.p1  ORF type:complete len:283 (-),score=35.83 TRINITY_DN49723_c0_g1_i1:25-849(-)
MAGAAMAFPPLDPRLGIGIRWCDELDGAIARYFAQKCIRCGTPVVSASTPLPQQQTPRDVKGSIRARDRPFVTAIGEPWLHHLTTGAKTYEGRLQGTGWAKLSVGDEVEAFSTRYACVRMVVQEILTDFDDFDAAFAALGRRLLPEGAATPQEALAVYRRIYSAEDVLEAGGVVIVGLLVTSVESAPLRSNREMEEIHSLEDLQSVLQQLLRSYCRGIPVHLIHQMLQTVMGRMWPRAACGGVRLSRIIRAPKLKETFKFEKSCDGAEYISLVA